ncbi:MAG: VOC family protein [Gammaproteobacteria bacterium]|nr:VOC family protein [Gammaproteobacteria bacterium]
MATRQKTTKHPKKVTVPAKKPTKVSASTAPRITPFLMYKEKCAEAAKFYASIFKNSKILSADTMSASFILDGQKFHAFNGGPHFNFSEGISLFVSCETQQEVDYYWNKLSADGGAESMCGWLRDKYGVSWQIIPSILMKLLGHKDREKAHRATQAMLQMKKISIQGLKDAVKD